MAGHDAGGNLSAALAMIARDRGGPGLRAQVLIAPMLDPTMARVRPDRLADADNSAEACAACYRQYLPRPPSACTRTPRRWNHAACMACRPPCC